jgi:hypothetical protein
MISKRQFFEVLDKAEVHQHQLDVVVAHRDLDYCIEVTGSTWCQGGLTHYEVYRPARRNQFKDWKATRAAIEDRLTILKGWLAEWREIHHDELLWSKMKLAVQYKRDRMFP